MAYVNFKDGTKKEIADVFGCPQPDAQMWPNQDEIEEDDPRLVEFLNPGQPLSPQTE